MSIRFLVLSERCLVKWQTNNFQIKARPDRIVDIQDNILLDYDFLETMCNSSNYPSGLSETNILDSINRLSSISFDLSLKSDATAVFDQNHYYNFQKVFIEKLVWTCHKLKKTKQELFRDNSYHVKVT